MMTALSIIGLLVYGLFINLTTTLTFVVGGYMAAHTSELTLNEAMRMARNLSLAMIALNTLVFGYFISLVLA